MKNRLPYNFKDGLLEYGTVQTKRNKVTRKEEGQEFTSDGKLFFDFKTIRQQDYDLYQTPEQTLDVKVQTYFVPGVEDSHKVKLDGDLFNINRIDLSSDRQTMFLYLSKLVGG